MQELIALPLRNFEVTTLVLAIVAAGLSLARQLPKDRDPWEELLAFSSKWIERKPATQTGYEHHLQALIYNNRIDGAFALAEK